MSKLNPKKRVPATRLAGGSGAVAAKQSAENQLRRAVLACLLWEDLAYESGDSDNISTLIPQVDPKTVAEIAVEARRDQKLRHVPLFIASEMLKSDKHRSLVGELLPKIITRPDQITDFLAIYWKKGKCPIAKQAKIGLAKCFNKFDEYSFAKYDRDGSIKLRDVMFLVKPKPEQGKEELFKKIAERTLSTPDTWEVALSTGKDKKETWTRLINEGKLGALAFLRNLRNMKEAGVDHNVIRKGFNISSQMLLPLNFLSAAQYAPEFKSDISDMMVNTYKNLPKLQGNTIFVVDVSGSMGASISGKSAFNRQAVANAMAMLAFLQCENIEVYATAGSDGQGKHQTQRIDYPAKGFDMLEQIEKLKRTLGGGGIFTRQCLEYIEPKTSFQSVDRIIVFSDSQDCDRINKIPNPFGANNYIVDVSANKHGINYKGKWTAEISGWSENFITYINVCEGLTNSFQEE
jgi:hypothetical protein